MVCSGDWEPRQPQDFVHGVADIMAPPWTRPESSDSFIPFHIVSTLSTASSSSASLDVRLIAYSRSGKELNGSALNQTVLG